MRTVEAPGSANGKRILIVDDEVDICEILQLHFELQGWSVKTANSGREARMLAALDSFDVILTDLRMPDGNGGEFIEQLKSLSKPRPDIYIMTGFNDGVLDESTLSGVRHVFQKPFSFETLVETMNAERNGS